MEREDRAPDQVPFPGGEVIAYSISSPNKTHNEDCAAVLSYPGGGILAVADGMGGQSQGDRASRLVVDTLKSHLVAGAKEQKELRHVVLDAAEAANKAVLELGVGAGSTLATIVVRNGNARAIHAGDSLALHVGQRGKIRMQTISHSPTGYAIEAGVLDESDALHHEERHIISNFVGIQAMHVEVGPSVPIASRDTLLVASDGLADNLTIAEIVEFIRKGPLKEAASKLVALAQERMSSPAAQTPNKPDDLTFVLYRAAN